MADRGERVLVVPRSSVLDAAGWHGVRRDGIEATLAVVAREGRFMAREEAERDPTHKQVIPYLVLRDGDRWSIGVGGHLNPGDGDVPGGLRREWDEELLADFVPEFTPVGLLNDDTTSVGSVHLGIVYVADAAGRPVAIRETDKLEGSFATTDEVATVRDGMETWSQLVFDSLTPVDD